MDLFRTNHISENTSQFYFESTLKYQTASLLADQRRKKTQQFKNNLPGIQVS